MKKTNLVMMVVIFALVVISVFSVSYALKYRRENQQLRSKLEAQNITVQVYGKDTSLIKNVFVEYTNGESLETFLNWLDENDYVDVEIQTSTYGGYIQKVEGIGGEDSYYWAIYSDSNVACKVPASDPNNYTEYDGYCSIGISGITVEYGDVFILRYISY